MVFHSTTPHLPPPQPPRPVGEARRLFWRWWRQQSPNAQDRYATLGPLVSVMLFLAAIIVAFWYLRNEELEREQESVKREDRKSTRLNSSHQIISYAVFCLKKKKKKQH